MRILHISDIHFCSPDCNDPDSDPETVYRMALRNDALRFIQQDKKGVDAIIVTGDIAYKANQNEYRAAKSWLTDLAIATSCNLSQIYVVPGNHDVDLSQSRETPTRITQESILRSPGAHKEKNLNAALKHEISAASLFKPLTAYNQFAKDFECDISSTSPCWKKDLNLDLGIKLRIHGATSVFVSGHNGQKDSKGGLYLSSRLNVINPELNVVNMFISHHPPSWFSDENEIRDTIEEFANIHMFGHEHRQRVYSDSRYVQFTAGAVNPERNEPKWVPGYNIVDIEIKKNNDNYNLNISASVRAWQNSPAKFVATIYENDSNRFTHSIALNNIIPVTIATEIQKPEKIFKAPSIVKNTYKSIGTNEKHHLALRFINLPMSSKRAIISKMDLLSDNDLEKSSVIQERLIFKKSNTLELARQLELHIINEET